MRSKKPKLLSALVNVLDVLTNSDFSLYATSVRWASNRVSFPDDGFAENMLSDSHVTVSLYLQWLEKQHFSVLLADGALLQLSYGVDGDSVLSHRLCYVPCPVTIDAVLADEFPVAEVVRSSLEQVGSVHLKTPVRFDFAPDDATEEHPASHLTLNNTECRIPCSAPLHPGKFVDFIFTHFYPVWRRQNSEWFDAIGKLSIGYETLSRTQSRELHVRWQH